MPWDFSTDPEWQEQLNWIEQFCTDEVDPFTTAFPAAVYPRGYEVPKALKEQADAIKQRVKDRGLWGIFLDKEVGGPGFGQLKLALVTEILSRHGAAQTMFGCMAPDTGNMDILAKYGTEDQKERWLKPLFNQEIHSCYSMTEPHGGADTRNFRTTAVKDGDHYVITGEKWFSSYGKTADIIIVMCNNGMFVVEKGAPGVEFLESSAGIHAHIRYNDVRVPVDNLLGGEGRSQELAQHRLSGGRIHQAMRAVAQVKLALDMMCERSISRESRGVLLADHQMVQDAIAESYIQYQTLRLFVLQTAWRIDHEGGRAVRHDIGACKILAAKTVRDVVYRAHHIHGALGTTNLIPLQGMWAGAPISSMADGPDEVHKVALVRELLKQYEPYEGLFPPQYIPARRKAALARYQWLIDSDPEVKNHVEQVDRRRGD